MKKKLVKVIICLFLGSATLSVANAQTDYERIISNINAEELRGVSITYTTNSVNAWMGSMNALGQFTDIDYTKSTIKDNVGDVPFHNHLDRLRQMAISYTVSSSSNFNNPALYSKIVLGLQYWNNNVNAAYNWWYNQIDYPKELGQLLVHLRYGSLYNSPATSDLSTTDYNNVIAYLEGRSHPITQTGANRTDEAIHWLYRGALTNNASVLDTATTYLWSTVALVNSYSEGLNSDYAFLQHGQQFYTQSYGDAWIVGVYYSAACMVGTSSTVQKLSPAQINMLYTYYHNSEVADMRGKNNDFSSMGRAISRKGVSGIDLRTIARAMKVDIGHIDDFRNDSLRLTGVQPANYNVATPYHIHYWTGDFTMHNRPAYSFTVRANSTRTYRTESINNENLLGEYLPDGATNIRVSGSEYVDIYPLWDWNKVPGVTMREFAIPQTNTSGMGKAGTTSFVGGVSDSSYGVSTYSLNYAGVQAKKSWFMFDSAIVCLGAGITSTASENIATGVNQSWLQNSTVYVNSGGAVSSLATNTSTNYNGSASWVWHNNIGYFFPVGGNVYVSNQLQTGNWNTINSSQTNATVTGNVFKLWLSHGVAPTNASYAYIVAPGIANTNDMGNYNTSNIKILSNTSSVQAVKHNGLNMLQIIFHTAGTIVDSVSQLKITVDNPCALLVKNVGTNKIVISVSDPSQSLSSLNIYTNFAYMGATYNKSVSLPTGNYKGSSVSFVIDGSNPPAQSGIAIADAYVRDGGYATTNYGTATSLVVKNDPSVGYSRQLYFKFDMSWLSKPVSKAILKLYRNYANTNASATKWVVYKTAGNWDEGQITWSNKPAFANAVDSIQGQLGTGYSQWDITTAVNSLSVNEMLSLAIASTVVNGVSDASFASREVVDSIQLPIIIVDTATPNLVAVQPVADAYVRDGNYAATNYGTATSLVVKNDPSAGYSRQSFIKFDLHGIPLTNLVGAKLQLYGYGNTGAGASNEYAYLVPNNTWSESGITWNNMPTATTLLDSARGTVGNAYYTWDVTAAVQGLAPDSLLSFEIASMLPNAAGDVSFNAREGASQVHSPTLILYRTVSPLTNKTVSPNSLSEKAFQSSNALQKESLLTVFPNPTKNYCNVSWDKVIKNITVYDINGRTIQEIRNVNNRQFQLQIGTLTTGIYLIKIESKGVEEIRRIMKN